RSASRRMPTICSSENLPFLMAPPSSLGVTLSSFSWSEKGQAGHLPGPSGLYGLLQPEGSLTLTAEAVPGLLPATGAGMLTYTARQGGRVWRNPVLVLQEGQEFRARLANGMQEPTIIHWHGVDCGWRQAGHPSYAVGPGLSYDYAFPITNRAGTYWYHPHPHGLTAKQSYLGLASFFLVRDAEEMALSRELDLTLGVTDLPIVLQDKRFDAHGGLVYAPSQDDLVMGYMGTEVLANGARQPTLDAATRLYRLRLLNGCTARIFNLAFLRQGRKMPVLLMANDGGLLDAPRPLDEVFLAPGERVEILLDLRGLAPGEAVTLVNAAFDPMHNEGTGHAGHGAPSADPHAGHGAAAPAAPAKPLDEGAAYPILRILVRRTEKYDRTVPTRFSALPAASGPATSGPVRRFDLALDRHANRWTINGLTYDMAASPVVVERRAPEAWAFAGAKDGMPHPMHLHGYFFRVDARQGSPEQVRNRAVDAQGRLATDLGLKDTVLVWPGETVAVTPDFGRPDYPGEQTFLLHCHNLEHEDQGMMLNVRVK
ncbi:MAG: multicopper oxidase family protein, partial [Proteobacteria bacterium]|nr:multicopper oxidase family protein [Pseudomonadota bacterium]